MLLMKLAIWVEMASEVIFVECNVFIDCWRIYWTRAGALGTTEYMSRADPCNVECLAKGRRSSCERQQETILRRGAVD